MVLSALHAIFHLILQQVWFCPHLTLQKRNWSFKWLRLICIVVIIIDTVILSEEMVILVSVPGSKGVRRAHPLAERQYGALGSAGLTLRRKGGVVALTGFCRMILSQLSLWFGVLATRIPACTSLRSRGLSCGCWSVFPSIMRHHGGIAPIVSLVGCTSLMSSHFLSHLCALGFLVPCFLFTA